METKQKPFDEVISELEQEIRSWQITVENRDAEILQLKGELEAVGAGGVQPLRATQPAVVSVGEREALIRYDVIHEFAQKNCIDYNALCTVLRAALATTPEVGPTKDEEERAFEDWLERTCPSGDHESVGRQWEASADYRELFTPAKAEVQAEPVATQVPASICEELDNVLTDPESKLSPGAERALRWMRSWVSVPLFTSPQATQQDAIDAGRWRETLRHIGAESHFGGQHFTVKTLPAPADAAGFSANLIKGAVAQHFTKAIDAAIQAAQQGDK